LSLPFPEMPFCRPFCSFPAPRFLRLVRQLIFPTFRFSSRSAIPPDTLQISCLMENLSNEGHCEIKTVTGFSFVFKPSGFSLLLSFPLTQEIFLSSGISSTTVHSKRFRMLSRVCLLLSFFLLVESNEYISGPPSGLENTTCGLPFEFFLSFFFFVLTLMQLRGTLSLVILYFAFQY